MFTVSVGNLPPGALVLIKITYVTELTVDREHICFSLPGSVAPWKRDKALEEVTQVYYSDHFVVKSLLISNGNRRNDLARSVVTPIFLPEADFIYNYLQIVLKMNQKN